MKNLITFIIIFTLLLITTGYNTNKDDCCPCKDCPQCESCCHVIILI